MPTKIFFRFGTTKKLLLLNSNKAFSTPYRGRKKKIHLDGLRVSEKNSRNVFFHPRHSPHILQSLPKKEKRKKKSRKEKKNNPPAVLPAAVSPRFYFHLPVDMRNWKSRSRTSLLAGLKSGAGQDARLIKNFFISLPPIFHSTTTTLFKRSCKTRRKTTFPKIDQSETARIFENLNCGPVFGYVRGVKREKKKGRLRNFSPVLEKKSQTYIKPYSDFLHKFIRIASVHKAAAAVAAKCILRIACDESTHICGRTPACHPRLNFQ